MAKLIKIYWRDIPMQVKAQKGRKTVKVLLSSRFQEGVDRAAMRAGKGTSDAYMEGFQTYRSECSDDLQAEAEQAAAELEAAFSEEHLEAVVKAKGIEADAKPR